MNKSLFALVAPLLLAGLAAPTIGHAAEPAPAPSKPTTPPAKLSDFSCLIRMMQMANLAGKAAQDAKKDEGFRSSASKLEAEARRAAFFYIGRIGPDWFAVDRSSEGFAEFKAMGAMPREQLSSEVKLCLDGSRAANEQMIASIKSKPATK